MMSGALRPLVFEEADVESERHGCPMLMRAREVYTPGHELPSHRCHFGWAIHGVADIERCMAVESSLECWKQARERMSVLPGPGPRETETRATAD